MIHIDDWLDTPTFDKEETYAKFVLDYMRYPAWKKSAYWEYMKQFPLFCIYKGEAYRVTGASRLGDIWLAKDPERVTGYDLRVDVSECSQWRNK